MSIMTVFSDDMTAGFPTMYTLYSTHNELVLIINNNDSMSHVDKVATGVGAVSYTHLTLPTIYSV